MLAVVYRRLVARQMRKAFAALSRGEHEALLRRLAPDVHHVFAGQSPLGGERHGREAVRLWFERLARLCPQMTFDVTRVLVSGPPWDMDVAVEWVAEVVPAAGEPYVNRGMHMIHIRLLHATTFRAYEDSQAVAEACRQMAAAGVAEASAEPIVS